MMGDDSLARGLSSTRCRGKEVFEIHPVILGGSPTDPANKTVLSREEHIQAVVYWNRVIKQHREEWCREKEGRETES
jgi:hypothetical protein